MSVKIGDVKTVIEIAEKVQTMIYNFFDRREKRRKAQEAKDNELRDLKAENERLKLEIASVAKKTSDNSKDAAAT